MRPGLPASGSSSSGARWAALDRLDVLLEFAMHVRVLGQLGIEIGEPLRGLGTMSGGLCAVCIDLGVQRAHPVVDAVDLGIHPGEVRPQLGNRVQDLFQRGLSHRRKPTGDAREGASQRGRHV